MSVLTTAPPLRFRLPRPRTRTGWPLVMGIVNVTPDSFSDGGQFASAEAAAEHALRLEAEGADILDVGGESTRPGAEPVALAEELHRVIPVIERIRARSAAAISVDTLKPAVAQAAFAAGADIWNDVYALRQPGALEAAAALGKPVILMHMKGEPRSMQESPRYDDVVGEVIAFLNERIAAAEAAGVAPGLISIDPGIGFGKTLDHNLSLMRSLERLRGETGKPLVFGASRKRFIYYLDPSAAKSEDRLGGSLATAIHAAAAGADVIRVHDVRETVQALEVLHAIQRAPA